MLKRTKLLASAAVFALTAGIASADGHGDMTAETVVASVNGSNITLGQLISLRSQLPPQYQELDDAVVFNGLISQLVDQQLLGDSLEEEPKRIAITLENELRSLRAGEVVNAIRSTPPSEADIQAAYDTLFEGQEPGTEYNASHILLETEEEAIAIKAEIDGGADFAQSAIDNSTGPSGPSGGELGWFGPGMMVAPFEEAVTTLEPGEVSDPVETQFGWHIVKLNDIRQTELPTLDSLREDLIAEVQNNTLVSLLESLRADADVVLPEEGQFDMSLIRNLELLED